MENEYPPVTETSNMAARPEAVPEPGQPPERPAFPYYESSEYESLYMESRKYNRPENIYPRRKRGFWHHLLLQIAGMCCYAVLIGLAALTWGYTVYSRQGYIEGGGLLPLYIFLVAVFLSSCLITMLARGGAIFPALLFSLLANGASFLLAGVSPPPVNALLLKAGISLLTAAAAFTITKLFIVTGRRNG
ncbi:MAG: hypothetical protein FWG06_00535 [Clostridiales bacterium]|nr:hypothetical protein [Clostridiales bacterium]